MQPLGKALRSQLERERTAKANATMLMKRDALSTTLLTERYFASPAPLATARYCVPIHHRQGRNHISRQSWQILERLDEVSA